MTIIIATVIVIVIHLLEEDRPQGVRRRRWAEPRWTGRGEARSAMQSWGGFRYQNCHFLRINIRDRNILTDIGRRLGQCIALNCNGCFGHMILKYLIFICDKYKYQLERNTDAKNLTNPTHLNTIQIIWAKEVEEARCGSRTSRRSRCWLLAWEGPLPSTTPGIQRTDSF